MGAWIEIALFFEIIVSTVPSHPTMGAWIEINLKSLTPSTPMSHPTMGAWIEIQTMLVWDNKTIVAPHDGCVD